MRVRTFSKDPGMEWETHSSTFLPDQSHEAMLLRGMGPGIFPANSITIEYEDGTQMQYIKETP